MGVKLEGCLAFGSTILGVGAEPDVEDIEEQLFDNGMADLSVTTGGLDNTVIIYVDISYTHAGRRVPCVVGDHVRKTTESESTMDFCWARMCEAAEFFKGRLLFSDPDWLLWANYDG